MLLTDKSSSEHQHKVDQNIKEQHRSRRADSIGSSGSLSSSKKAARRSSLGGPVGVDEYIRCTMREEIKEEVEDQMDEKMESLMSSFTAAMNQNNAVGRAASSITGVVAAPDNSGSVDQFQQHARGLALNNASRTTARVQQQLHHNNFVTLERFETVTQEMETKLENLENKLMKRTESELRTFRNDAQKQKQEILEVIRSELVPKQKRDFLDQARSEMNEQKNQILDLVREELQDQKKQQSNAFREESAHQRLNIAAIRNEMADLKADLAGIKSVLSKEVATIFQLIRKDHENKRTRAEEQAAILSQEKGYVTRDQLSDFLREMTDRWATSSSSDGEQEGNKDSTGRTSSTSSKRRRKEEESHVFAAGEVGDQIRGVREEHNFLRQDERGATTSLSKPRAGQQSQPPPSSSTGAARAQFQTQPEDHLPKDPPALGAQEVAAQKPHADNLEVRADHADRAAADQPNDIQDQQQETDVLPTGFEEEGLSAEDIFDADIVSAEDDRIDEAIFDDIDIPPFEDAVDKLPAGAEQQDEQGEAKNLPGAVVEEKRSRSGSARRTSGENFRPNAADVPIPAVNNLANKAQAEEVLQTSQQKKSTAPAEAGGVLDKKAQSRPASSAASHQRGAGRANVLSFYSRYEGADWSRQDDVDGPPGYQNDPEGAQARAAGVGVGSSSSRPKANSNQQAPLVEKRTRTPSPKRGAKRTSHATPEKKAPGSASKVIPGKALEKKDGKAVLIGSSGREHRLDMFAAPPEKRPGKTDITVMLSGPIKQDPFSKPLHATLFGQHPHEAAPPQSKNGSSNKARSTSPSSKDKVRGGRSPRGNDTSANHQEKNALPVTPERKFPLPSNLPSSNFLSGVSPRLAGRKSDSSLEGALADLDQLADAGTTPGASSKQSSPPATARTPAGVPLLDPISRTPKSIPTDHVASSPKVAQPRAKSFSFVRSASARRAPKLMEGLNVPTFGTAHQNGVPVMVLQGENGQKSVSGRVDGDAGREARETTTKGQSKMRNRSDAVEDHEPQRGRSKEPRREEQPTTSRSCSPPPGRAGAVASSPKVKAVPRARPASASSASAAPATTEQSNNKAATTSTAVVSQQNDAEMRRKKQEKERMLAAMRALEQQEEEPDHADHSLDDADQHVDARLDDADMQVDDDDDFGAWLMQDKKPPAAKQGRKQSSNPAPKRKQNAKAKASPMKNNVKKDEKGSAGGNSKPGGAGTRR
ncbi:unnamed protein product [Amoebophrya sp. A120]|nr:unnamed protein product [Amoebophrya sp. A120]|eukprot:GSA120T00002716001.1